MDQPVATPEQSSARPASVGETRRGDFHFEAGRGRAPTREYACPECQIKFAAPGTRQGGISGKTCPEGHWHSIYQLQYFEQHGKLPTPRPKRDAAPPPKPQSAPKPARQALRDLGIMTRGQQSELALQWWMSDFERLLDTLPDGVVKLLVEGAFDRTYKLSRQIIPAPAAKPNSAFPGGDPN